MPLDDIQYVFLLQRIKSQYVLTYFLSTLFERGHLLLVTQYADDVISCNYTQFRVQRTHHLQMGIPRTIENHGVNIL